MAITSFADTLRFECLVQVASSDEHTRLFFHQESSKSSIIDSHNLMPQAITCIEFVQANGGAKNTNFRVSIKYLALVKSSLFANTLPEMLSDCSTSLGNLAAHHGYYHLEGLYTLSLVQEGSAVDE